MASLVGNAINASCGGLLKTTDNAIIGATEKRVTDGLGNATNMTIGTGGTSFDSGTVDFTGATVSGLPAGAAGLESGTGTDSMQSAASLTTTAANAAGADSIALGNGAITTVTFTEGVAIGKLACTSGPSDVSIGASSHAQSGNGVAIGNLSHARNTQSIAIGYNSCAYDLNGIAMGPGAIGCSNGTISIGNGAKAGLLGTGYNAISFGNNSNACDWNSVAIGCNSVASACQAIALGAEVTAAKQNTVTVKELETCVAGGGITMKSADTTEEKMTLTDADVLAIGGDTIPANDTATPTTVNRIWSGTSAQYTALGTYDANTLYYVS